VAVEASRIGEKIAAQNINLRNKKRYFRFYVQQGLSSPGWEKRKGEAEVEKAMSNHLSSQGGKIGFQDCVQNLMVKQGELQAATIVGQN